MEDNNNEDNETSFLAHALVVVFALVFIAVASIILGWGVVVGIGLAGVVL